MGLTDSTKPKGEGRSVPVGIGTAILLFGFILQFFSVRQSLPIEIQIVSAVFVGATAFLFAVWAWYPPLARYRTERQQAGREDRISRESLENFQSYVEQLRKTCTGQYMDTILHPLQTLKAQGEFSKIPEMIPWINSVNSLIHQVAGLFDRVEVNRHTFVWTVDTFTSVLGMFNDSLNRIVNEARLVAEQKPIPRLVREEYNTYRDSYNRFLDDYTAFVDGLNKRFRSYELTIPLPGGNSTTTTEYAFRKVYAERPKEL